VLFSYLSSVLFLSQVNVLFMYNFSVSFVNNWDVLLVNVFLINDGLDVLMNHWSVMFMDDFSVLLVHNLLMMFVDNFSVSFLDDWLFNDGLDDRCLGVGENLSSRCIGSIDGCFVMSDNDWSLSGDHLLSSKVRMNRCSLGQYWSLNELCISGLNELGCDWSSLNKLSLLHHWLSFNESSSWCATSFDDDVTLMDDGIVLENVLLVLVLLSEMFHGDA